MTTNSARRARSGLAALGCVIAVGVSGIPANAGTRALGNRTSSQEAGRANGRVGAACCATASTEQPPSARFAVIQAMARQQWLRAEQARGAGPAGTARGTASLRAALAAERARTGVLTGVVHGVRGRPVAGACVTATGPGGSSTARSRGDGQYVLAGLAAGRYVVRVSDCGASSAGSGSVAAAALWAGLPARVVLGSGQRRVLPPVTMETAGDFAASAQPSTAGRAGTGGISGRLTGQGRPLQGICVSAQPVRGGIGGGALTSSSGRYRITGLPPGRYDAQFAEVFCGHGNWLSQWYPGITTPFQPPKAVAIRVRAGTTKSGIDASL